MDVQALKPRDIFDVAVILTRHEDLLADNLHVLRDVRGKLLHRLETLPQAYHERVLEELEILPAWDHLKPRAKDMVAGLVHRIPA